SVACPTNFPFRLENVSDKRHSLQEVYGDYLAVLNTTPVRLLLLSQMTSATLIANAYRALELKEKEVGFEETPPTSTRKFIGKLGHSKDTMSQTSHTLQRTHWEFTDVPHE
ncbi:hypothetical protein AVEN_233815-1, partial [Araneus ventricosus]